MLKHIIFLTYLHSLFYFCSIVQFLSFYTDEKSNKHVIYFNETSLIIQPSCEYMFMIHPHPETGKVSFCKRLTDEGPKETSMFLFTLRQEQEFFDPLFGSCL